MLEEFETGLREYGTAPRDRARTFHTESHRPQTKLEAEVAATATIWAADPAGPQGRVHRQDALAALRTLESKALSPRGLRIAELAREVLGL